MDLQSFTVRVKNLQGNIFDLVVEPCCTVQQFKDFIWEKTQIPVENQKLIYMGRVLKDCSTLESYDIRENCVVHLVGKCASIEATTSSTSDTTMSDVPVSANVPPTTCQSLPFVAPPETSTHFLQPDMSSGAAMGRGRGFHPLDFFRAVGVGQFRSQCQQNRTNQLCNARNKATAPATQPTQPSTQLTTSVTPTSVNCNSTSAQSFELELDQAITRGCIERTKQLVDTGAQVNRGGLHKACMFGQFEIARFLISKGAKVELKLANGETCVHTCAYYGQKEILEYLITECGASIYDRTNDGKTALLLAVYNNHRSVVETLLQFGANVHDNDVHGTTPLIVAAQKGNKEIVELLLKFNAKIDARDSRGRTALHFSASGGFPNILVLLLQHGAPINAMNSNRETALHYAAYHGKRDCLLCLLTQGADVNIVSNSGTALQLARSKNQMEVVDLLSQFGNGN